MRPWKVCLAYALLSFSLRSQGIDTIPPPTGPFAIGRVGYHWIDRSRPDGKLKDSSAHRELMVYFWYPATKDQAGPPASYLPAARQFDAIPEVQARMRRTFVDSWPAMLSGAVRTHAQERAAVANAPNPFPLVIFSHGAGNSGFNYTSLIEDVVSHGYVVAAIEHTYTAKAVWFPDGRVVPFDDEPPPAGLSTSERARWNGSQITKGIEVGAADVRFVLDRILEMNNDSDHFLLAHRIDATRAAPMGHSAGAEFSARACQIDSRFRACVDLDGGMVPVAALPLAPDGAPMKPPLLFLEAFHPESTMGGLPHETIAAYQKTREEQLRACPPGTYAVVLRSPGIAHPSFSDMPFLLAGQPEIPERSVALHNLELIRRFVRDFLDRTLKGERAPLFESGKAPLPEATVESYGR